MMTKHQDSMTRRSLLGGAAATGGMLMIPWLKRLGAKVQPSVDPEEQKRVEAAIPAKAFVTPRKARKLLIFDLNVNYGGHASIRTSNLAFTLMGAKTGAFETEISHDPAVFAPDSLRRFDAVFFNNTVGNCFEDPALRQSLVEFVYAGGGLMGVHGTSVAFMKWPGAIEDWPEFGIMLGARGANHKANDEHVFIKLDDPTHPIVGPFGSDFDYRDEFFRVHEPYSRNRVRVLLSIDTAKTDMTQTPSLGKVERADNDYALAWVRQYGRGRVFYCGFAHHPSVFWDPKMLQFYLAATQFALGDLPAPTTPSAKLTLAIRVQEKLGWRLGLALSVPGAPTLVDPINKAAELGLLYLGPGRSGTANQDKSEDFEELPSDTALGQIRARLNGAGVRQLAYPIPQIPSDAASSRRIFEIARRMGIEILAVEQPPGALAAVEKLCNEYDISLAISSTDKKSAPQELVELCRNHGRRIGVSGNVNQWMDCGIDPVEAVRLLGDRLMALQLSNTDKPIQSDEIRAILAEIYRRGIQPMVFSVECASEGPSWTAQATRCIELFNKVTVQLADGGKS
jgi:type 1 glutamine amidotransferase/sugar phosphate isomerase/epimerase